MRLALETSTDICSVAFEDERKEIHEKRTESRGAHSEMLFEFIREFMEEQGFTMADLEALIVSEGPGSYTGLRISASAVKGLLFKEKVPLLAANTLASFAASAVKGIKPDSISTIHSVIDARRVHLYHQSFKASTENIEPIDRVEVIPIKKFEQMVTEDDIIIGTGLDRISQEVRDKCTLLGSEYISARSLFDLSDMQASNDESSPLIRQADLSDFEPRYHTSSQVNNK